MRFILFCAMFLTISGATVVSADSTTKPEDVKVISKTENDQKTTLDEIKGMQRDLSTLFQSSAGRYALESLERAKSVLQNAQSSAESGKLAQAHRSVELAGVLVLHAKTVAEEKEAVEKTAIKRAELKRLEERVDALLKGKEQ